MHRIELARRPDLMSARDLDGAVGREVRVHGAVQRIRRLSWGAFVVLRRHDGLLQCVVAAGVEAADLDALREGQYVRVTGEVRQASLKDASISPRNVEVHASSIECLLDPVEPLRIDLTKKVLDLHIDTNLDNRPVSLRHPVERARLRISEGLGRAFREYHSAQGFTEIRTPKICFAGAEGGANIFKVQYFDREAFLAQSPQFYKQMGVAVFERVFEVGPVFRAEPHQTSRHINEYTSLDLEMGFIDSFHDVMAMEIGYLRAAMGLLASEYAPELEMLEADLPEVPAALPSVRLEEAHEIAGSMSGQDFSGEPDLDPEEERLLCEHSLREWGSEFLFVTHFPSSKRPFYTMDDPERPGETLSFDLLFRGLEITTGGQRIHGYQEQAAKLMAFGLDPAGFESYLMAHRAGLPPHGGLAIGLERLTARILRVENIRLACMFPRDVKRLVP
ncbi:aspartate--tRNA(Asn) ligase [Candidatus Fermentibacterales bacterium]|nr:aspartate--tRNA(Asn) ligase [Candidatus Fermentibacterales bacterium]